MTRPPSRARPGLAAPDLARPRPAEPRLPLFAWGDGVGPAALCARSGRAKPSDAPSLPAARPRSCDAPRHGQERFDLASPVAQLSSGGARGGDEAALLPAMQGSAADSDQ